MPRLFVALAMPEQITMHLSLMRGGIPGARWVDPDDIHLTLAFIGEVDGGEARRVADALGDVRGHAMTLELCGMGHFPPRGKPRSLWAGVAQTDAVTKLHDAVRRGLERIGVDTDRRNFAPHVTIARLRDPPAARVAEYLSHHALFRSAPFEVRDFRLYSSVLSRTGPKYRVERRYALDEPPAADDGPPAADAPWE